MKAITHRSILVIVIAIMMTSTTFAQPQGGRGNGNGPACINNNSKGVGIENVIPDLSEDQISALKELRTAHLKEMKDFSNQMGELNAKERTIMSADPIDQKAANSLIDQKTALMNKQMKAKVDHKADLQEILSEEQMLVLEQHQQHRQFAQNDNRPGPNKEIGGNYGPHQKHQSW